MNNTQLENQLYRELEKLARRANQRIRTIERVFGKDTWAVKRLRNKLDIEPLKAWTKTGRVKFNKSMTELQMKATIIAVNNFLNSKTSTLKGIKQARQKQIQAISKALGEEEDLSYEEAEALYDTFEDDDFKEVYKYIEPSKFWGLNEDAKEENDTEDMFLKRVKKYINFGNDADLIERLKRIYYKYVM